MKVVLVSLARRGGMVHFVAELANALVPLCQPAVVVSSSAPGTYFSRRVGKIQVRTGGSTLGGVLHSVNPFAWLTLFGRLAAENADVVHIVGVHQWNPMVACLS